MRFSLEFRAESLLFLAFMATVPVFSPNMVLFTKGFPYAELLIHFPKGTRKLLKRYADKVF